MSNRNLVITTPRGTLRTVTLKSGKVTARLEWSSDFGRAYTACFTSAQKFIDNEVLRFCDSRIPLDTGMLKKSGTLGTVVGSGVVQYSAPYSTSQYYNTATSRSYDSNRGAFWFERGKVVERARIIAGAAKIAGGGK